MRPTGTPPCFVVWDVKGSRLDRILPIPSSALSQHSDPNDFVLDARHNAAHIADGALGASYRVRVADLSDQGLPDAELAAPVERCASRPNAGGYSIDAEDDLYMTELGGRAIGVIPAADWTYRRMAEHPGMSCPAGTLYVTVSQLPLNSGTRGDQQPHLRTHPLAPGRMAG